HRPLALAEAARPLLEGGDLLLELRVLLEHGLVVLGDVVEEGIDLVDVEPPKPSNAELLLTDVERADAHQAPPTPISVAIRYSTGTRNSFKKYNTRMTIIGEKSRPIWVAGSRSRTGRSTGSVTRCRKRTSGL